MKNYKNKYVKNFEIIIGVTAILTFNLLSGCGRDVNLGGLFKNADTPPPGSTQPTVGPHQHDKARLNDTGIDFYINYKDFGPTKPVNPNQAEYIYNTFTTGLPVGQDAETGRDITDPSDTDGHKGFSFTKLDATSGEDLPGDVPQWGCVRDNVTNLIWENKRNAGIHNYNNKFIWFNDDKNTNGGDPGESYEQTLCPKDDGSGKSNVIASDTKKFIELVNQERLCGLNNWRLPTVEELRSIMDYSSDPMVDTKYFEHIHSSAHLWSIQSDYNKPEFAWAMHMLHGTGHTHSKACSPSVNNGTFNYTNNVMLVSGSATY